MNKKYTYDRLVLARYGFGCAIVPDQVADNQKHYNGRVFPAIIDGTGKTVRVVLRGDLYGLCTHGTGDMIVTAEQRRKKW